MAIAVAVAVPTVLTKTGMVAGKIVANVVVTPTINVNAHTNVGAHDSARMATGCVYSGDYCDCDNQVRRNTNHLRRNKRFGTREAHSDGACRNIRIDI